MDADRLSDTLADALVDLRTTRQLLHQTSTLLVMAWNLARQEGRAWGPELPEQLQMSQLPQLLAPHLNARLAGLPAPESWGPAPDATNGAQPVRTPAPG